MRCGEIWTCCENTDKVLILRTGYRNGESYVWYAGTQSGLMTTEPENLAIQVASEAEFVRQHWMDYNDNPEERM